MLAGLVSSPSLRGFFGLRERVQVGKNFVVPATVEAEQQKLGVSIRLPLGSSMLPLWGSSHQRTNMLSLLSLRKRRVSLLTPFSSSPVPTLSSPVGQNPCLSFVTSVPLLSGLSPVEPTPAPARPQQPLTDLSAPLQTPSSRPPGLHPGVSSVHSCLPNTSTREHPGFRPLTGQGCMLMTPRCCPKPKSHPPEDPSRTPQSLLPRSCPQALCSPARQRWVHDSSLSPPPHLIYQKILLTVSAK